MCFESFAIKILGEAACVALLSGIGGPQLITGRAYLFLENKVESIPHDVWCLETEPVTTNFEEFSTGGLGCSDIRGGYSEPSATVHEPEMSHMVSSLTQDWMILK